MLPRAHKCACVRSRADGRKCASVRLESSSVTRTRTKPTVVQRQVEHRAGSSRVLAVLGLLARIVRVHVRVCARVHLRVRGCAFVRACACV